MTLTKAKDRISKTRMNEHARMMLMPGLAPDPSTEPPSCRNGWAIPALNESPPVEGIESVWARLAKALGG